MYICNLKNTHLISINSLVTVMNCQQTVLLSRFKPPTAGYRQDKKSDEAHRVPITHPQPHCPEHGP